MRNYNSIPFPLPLSHLDPRELNIDAPLLNIDAPILQVESNFLGYREKKRFPIWPLIIFLGMHLVTILACTRTCGLGEIEHIDGSGNRRCVKAGSGDIIIDGSDNYGPNYSTDPTAEAAYTPAPPPPPTEPPPPTPGFPNPSCPETTEPVCP